MKKNFFLASAIALATSSPVIGQVYPPAIGSTPGYSRGTSPGYTWRDQRGTGDWRNNNWREQQFDQDWRNNDWRQERANEDYRQREDYAKQRTPNNPIDRGYTKEGERQTTTGVNPADQQCGSRVVGGLPKPCPETPNTISVPSQNPNPYER